MSTHAAKLDERLRAGDVDGAMEAAGAWAQEGSDNPRDTAVEIARAAGTVYRDLVAQPVHDFQNRAEQELPGSIGSTVSKALGRLVDITRDWETKIRGCYEERMARELRDCVRTKDWAGAMRHVAALCEAVGDDPDEMRQRATYLGAILGTLVNQPKEAEYLVNLIARDPEPVNLTVELAAVVAKERESRHRQMLKADLHNLENQWTQTLRSVQTEVLGEMPRRNKMGDPDDDDLRIVGDVYRSLLRVPFWRHEEEMLADATLILADFLPHPTGGSSAYGVEGRGYARMGFRARKASALVFQEIGKNEWFTKRYAEWAKDRLDKPYREEIVEVMGALRCERYGPQFIAWWNDKKLRDLRPELALALGNLATPEAADILMKELEDLVNTSGTSLGERINQFKISVEKGLDEGGKKRARALMASLGRIVRSPRCEAAEKRRIVNRVIAATPHGQRDMASMVAMNLIVPAPDAVEEKERTWAVNALVDAMWIQDQSHALQQEGERVDTNLGPRAPLANALIRLGKTNTSDVVESIERHCTELSGAYLAAAHVLQGLAAPEGASVLEKMALTALVEDISAAGKYQAETVWDPATRERVPLTPDLLMGALARALGEIGSDEAMASLRTIRDRIASGRVRSPGPETVRELHKFVGFEERDKETGSDKGGASAKRPRRAEADPKEVARLIKTLKSSHMLKGASKKAQLKIEALARLGQMLPEEAMEPVAAHLTHSNSMVQSAAIATFAGYAAPGEPKALFERVMAVFEDFGRSSEEPKRKAAGKLLKEIGPHRSEVRRRISEIAGKLDSASEKDYFRRALNAADYTEAASQPAGPDVGGEKIADNVRLTDTTAVRKLSAKQEYFQARQEWIAGGKKGTPPEPPRELKD